MKFLKNKKGFTLIELIVVMAIIGILVLLAAPKFLGYTKDAEVAAMRADAKVLSNAALLYNIENNGGWPVAASAVEGEVYDSSKAFAFTADDALDAYLETVDANYEETASAYTMDATLLADYIKNIKGDLEDYVLIVDGALQGEVIHKSGIVDRTGTSQFGLVDNTVVQP